MCVEPGHSPVFDFAARSLEHFEKLAASGVPARAHQLVLRHTLTENLPQRAHLLHAPSPEPPCQREAQVIPTLQPESEIPDRRGKRIGETGGQLVPSGEADE